MSTVFIQTNEGAAHDHAVRMGKTQSSGLAAIVCYTGTPVTDVVDIKALTAATAGTECYRILEANIPQTDISNVSTLLEPELPEQLTVHITALGYLLKNGVFWGYVPYRPANGGLVKDNTFSWVMKLVCTSTDSPTLAVEYSSLDLRSLANNLYAAVYKKIYNDLYDAFYVSLCSINAAPITTDTECIHIPLSMKPLVTITPFGDVELRINVSINDQDGTATLTNNVAESYSIENENLLINRD